MGSNPIGGIPYTHKRMFCGSFRSVLYVDDKAEHFKTIGTAAGIAVDQEDCWKRSPDVPRTYDITQQPQFLSATRISVATAILTRAAEETSASTNTHEHEHQQRHHQNFIKGSPSFSGVFSSLPSRSASASSRASAAA